MKMENVVLGVAACTLMLALPLSAQEEEKKTTGHDRMHMEMAAMMEAMEEAGTPGEAHRALEPLAGRWNATVRLWMDPAGEPMVMDATSESRWILDGRYLREEVESEFMDKPFHGIGLTGYNNATGEYESAWVDSHSTAIFRYTGSRTADGFEFAGEMTDPATGQPVAQRTVIRIVSDDEIVAEGYETRDGAERRTMEIVYRRAGA